MKTLLTILLLTFSAYTQSVTAPTITATANDKVDVEITADELQDIIACQN